MLEIIVGFYWPLSNVSGIPEQKLYSLKIFVHAKMFDVVYFQDFMFFEESDKDNN